jgi:aspartyl-tRNA(Asn)/glutamyl-tRNA(Gln) amidotransferase subunit C
MLTKKDLEKLAELARMDLKPNEEKKLLKDLSSVLDYFEELKEVDTENVEPLTGATESFNVFRSDDDETVMDKEKAMDAFPEKSGGYLKVPPVFE